jgi:hypothetical protein
MKRISIALCIFLTAAFGLLAQTRFAGFGIAYDLQSVSSSYEGTDSSLNVSSIAFGVDAFSGGILSVYTGADFGLATAGNYRSGSVSGNLDMSDYSMKLTMSCVSGIGSMIELGSLTLLVGAGVGIDAVMLEPDDYRMDALITMAIGPGLSLGCAYRFSPGFGVYANVRGIYNMMQIVGEIEGYKSGFSISPTIGLAITN